MAVNDSRLAEAFNTASQAWQEQWLYWPGGSKTAFSCHAIATMLVIFGIDLGLYTSNLSNA